jgi:DnaJ-class molecular chaperone
MSRQEALSVLGLDGEPSHDDVRNAHRRLIQKLHPDRGGTDYLAAKINQAKDVLLTR